MNSLSVVIPSYNSPATLPCCLEALEAQLEWQRDEVIVVDSSADSHVDALSSRFRQVRWERQKVRLFPGAARNLGARLARRDWVAFVDADIQVQPGWRAVIDRLAGNIVAVGGPVEAAWPRSRWGLARYWIEFGQFAPTNLPGRNWNIPSCNMVWLRSVFLETGGFPEDFASADDLLFNYRNMKLRCRQFILLHELKVAHPADSQKNAVQEHLERLGYWSGRARLQGVRPAVTHSRLAAPLLYFYRLGQVWRRCLRGAPFTEAQSLLGPIAKGVSWWYQGFYRGLGEGSKISRE
ncbi:MAG TPA: glycosyltransferase [Acidobacteriota bacterium]|jgi:glycosyltransferase involved in cell wall biosynthesis|nr:glycosyltransferase [Acidobacteriota bacterium]